MSDPAPVGAGLGIIGPAAARAWRAARVLGEGARKPAGGKGKEDRGRAVKKKGYTMDYTIIPRPVASI